MHITDCPDRFAFFNDLPRAEQAKMALHVEVLKQLLSASDYMTDSLSVSEAQSPRPVVSLKLENGRGNP